MPPGPVEPAGDDGAAAFLRHADAHLADGDCDRAAAAYAVALRFDRRNLAALAGLGRVHLKTGNFAEARRALYAARALAPDDGEIAKLLGEFLTRIGKYGRAAAEFLRAMEIEAEEEEADDRAASRAPPPPPSS